MHDVAIKQDGQIVESHANLEQYQQTNWHTQIWSDGSAPNARVVYDPDYLMNSGAVPRLDTRITVNNSDLQQQYDAFLASDTGPMGSALWDTAMGKTGDRPDIGPVTNWTAEYLISQDARADGRAIHGPVTGADRICNAARYQLAKAAELVEQSVDETLIPSCTDQNTWAHFRRPMEMIVQG